MKRIKVLLNNFLILFFISFNFHSQIYASDTSEIPYKNQRKRVSEDTIRKMDKINHAEHYWAIESMDDYLTIDEIFELFQSLDTDDDIDDLYTEKELKIINSFLILIARIGVSPENSEQLEKDIQELLLDEDEESYSFSSPNYDSNQTLPVSFCSRSLNQPDIVFCTNIIKKTGRGIKKGVKETGRFVRRNWEPLALGTSVVAAAAGITYVVIKSKSSEPSKPSSQNKPLEIKQNVLLDSNKEKSNIANSDLTSSLTQIVQESVQTFKNETQKDNNLYYPKNEPNFWQKTQGVIKEYSGSFAHTILDEVTDFTKFLAIGIDQTIDLYDRIMPEEVSIINLKKDPEKTFTQTYEEEVFKEHQKIDQLFDIDFSSCYTKEAKEYKEYREKDWSIGILPPPDGLFNRVTIKKLLDAGKCLDKGALTKAGRALAKHGGREGSVFPKPKGNTMQINLQGQAVLESILNDSKTVYTNRFGGIDIYNSKGQGVRFNKENEFMGFLQPKK